MAHTQSGTHPPCAHKYVLLCTPLCVHTEKYTTEWYHYAKRFSSLRSSPFTERRKRNGVSVFLASQEPVASIICACSHTCNRPVSVRATTTSPVPLWLAHTSKPTNRESPLKPWGNQVTGKIDGEGRWRMEEEGRECGTMREEGRGTMREEGGRRVEGGTGGGRGNVESAGGKE